MSRQPLHLDYENPDEERPAGGMSPVSQALLGLAMCGLMLAIAASIYLLLRAPAMAVLTSLSIGIGACLWAHLRWRWYEFAPAMAVGLVATLAGIPALWLLGWLLF